jgi:hypothetical protein
VDEVMHSTAVTDFSDMVNQMRVDYREPFAYMEQMQKIVGGWKQDYNRLCRI